jgi:hypothetical protein
VSVGVGLLLILLILVSAVGVVRTRSAEIHLISPSMDVAPPGAEVCTGAVTMACAREAAHRIGKPVAWLPAPHGYQSKHLLAARSLAIQELYSADVLLGVYTEPQTRPTGPVDKQVRVSGDQVEVRVQIDDATGGWIVIMDWDKDDVAYQLLATANRFPARPPAVDDYIALISQVKYAAALD